MKCAIYLSTISICVQYLFVCNLSICVQYLLQMRNPSQQHIFSRHSNWHSCYLNTTQFNHIVPQWFLPRRRPSAMLINQEFGAHSAPLESGEIYICLSSVGTFIESNNTWILVFFVSLHCLSGSFFYILLVWHILQHKEGVQVFVVQEIFHSKVVIRYFIFLDTH